MEKIILKKLIEDNDYIIKVFPFLKKDFFDSYETKLVYSVIRSFINKYNRKPTYTAIISALQKKDNINEDSYEKVTDLLQDVQDNYNEDHDFDWLIDETEDYCKDKAMENAIFSAVNIYEDKNEPNSKIESIVREALSVSFKNDLGIDFWDPKDIKKRHESMTTEKRKYPCHLDEFNTLCGGGIEPKALSVFMGDTHSGKTMSMVSLGASYVRNGYDVLYVTLEMSREKIAQLFDANYLDMEINDLPSLEFDEFRDSILETKKDSYGRLFIQEFPTAGASTMSIRNHINDLKLKSGFKPKIVIVDYINLMRSDRYSSGDSYTIIKAIAEELRGLMVEKEFAGISATQFNRGGAGSSDPSMTDTAESYGLPATCDLIIAMYGNEELSSKNIILWKSLKNRFGGIINHRLVINTKFEYAMLCNHKKDDDPVPYISNSPKTTALMAKMVNRQSVKKIDNTTKSDINELFDTFLD